MKINKLIKEYKQELLYTFVFIFVYVISFRKILVNFKVAFGHNWDYSFPEIQLLGKNVVDLSLYSWTNYFGENPLLTTHLPHNFIYSLLSTFFPPEINIRIILTVSILISFIGILKLANYINRDIEEKSRSQIAFLASLLYAFSPYFFSLLVGGSWYAWVSYSFAPVFIYNVLKFLSESNFSNENNKFYIGAIISIVFLIGFLQFFIISIVFVILLLNDQVKKTKILILALSSFLILSYCILPIVLSYKNLYTNLIGNKNLYNSFEAVLTSRHDIYSIITGVGFLNRNFYIEANYFPLKTAFYLYSLLIFYTLLTPLLKLSNNRSYLNLCLFLILLIVFVKGGNYPFPSISMTLYESLPLMKIYRSPQNLFWGTVICTIILLTMSLGILYKTNNTRFNLLIKTLFLCLPFYLSTWFINGDIGTNELKKKNMSSIEYYQVNKEIEEIFTYSEKNSSNQFDLYIPFAYSVEFLSTLNSNYRHQGGEPNYQYLNNISPIMKISSEDLFIKIFDNKYRLAEFLENNAIGYIIIRKDIKSHFYKNNEINFSELEKNLEYCCIKDYKSELYIRYKVKNKFHRKIINAKFKDLFIDDYQIDNEYLQKRNIFVNKISPVRYKINLNNISINDNLDILLNIPFSKNWKLYSVSDENRLLSGLAFIFSKEIIAEHEKYISTPYDLNKWNFNIENNILHNRINYKNNSNGLIDVEIFIYHSFQNYYYIGILISFICVFIILFIILKFRFNEKSKNI